MAFVIGNNGKVVTGKIVDDSRSGYNLSWLARAAANGNAKGDYLAVLLEAVRLLITKRFDCYIGTVHAANLKSNVCDMFWNAVAKVEAASTYVEEIYIALDFQKKVYESIIMDSEGPVASTVCDLIGEMDMSRMVSEAVGDRARDEVHALLARAGAGYVLYHGALGTKEKVRAQAEAITNAARKKAVSIW